MEITKLTCKIELKTTIYDMRLIVSKLSDSRNEDLSLVNTFWPIKVSKTINGDGALKQIAILGGEDYGNKVRLYPTGSVHFFGRQDQK